ncbi:MAG: DUF4870 domain-containing protein [Anaerolineales bacterium]|nr:DUF4870 domain-containing protein [Anaerolineales bacterium]
MNIERVVCIRKELDFYETSNLLEIWQLHDHDEWTDEAFDAIRQILISRGVELPSFEDRKEADKHLDCANEYAKDDFLQLALNECNMALQYAPHYAKVHFCTGIVLDSMDNLDEAMISYQEALCLDPDNKDAQDFLRRVKNERTRKFTTDEDRNCAAIAHFGVIFPLFGFLIPILIWTIQEKRSHYVAFQSLQALFYQLLSILFLLLSYSFSKTITIIGKIYISAALNPGQITKIVENITIIGLCIILLFLLVYIVYGIYGAIKVMFGFNFKYLIIGNLVERYWKREI